jgi:VIT1/CCC1 family predicted Fe2+/Mn2+ transporter
MKTLSIKAYLVAIMLFVISITAIYSCASKEEKTYYEGENKVSTKKTTDAPEAGGEKDNRSANDEVSDKNSSYVSEEQTKTEIKDNTVDKIPQKIIKTADVAFQVENYKESRLKILNLVKKNKALVSVERETNDGYRISNDMVIRVFSSSFDSLIDQIITCSIYIENKNINAEDVTEEFVDVSARLKTKKETENQYLEILKKARSIDEILAVQSKLQSIREEIESSQARLNYLDNRAQYSTINLKFYEKLPNVMQPDDSFGYRVSKALRTGWQGLVGFFIGLIYIWPLIFIGLAVTYFIIWLVKRKRKNRLLKQQKQ